MLHFLVACVAQPTSTTVLRFEPAKAPMDVGAVPFPSDLYRQADGRIALGALPGTAEGSPLYDALRELFGARAGFCTTCAATFQVQGELDAVSEEAVFIVDVDTGQTFPSQLQWFDGTLTVRPRPGHVLPAGHRIAIAVTDALHGGDGLPLARPLALARVLDGAGEPNVARVLVPGVLALEALGVPRHRIVGLTVFTTDDPSQDLRAVRQAVRGAPPVVPTAEDVWTGLELDDLLGIVGEDRPGIDVPPLAGTDGTRSVPHETTATVIAGRWRAPRFVEGQGTDVGVLSRDVNGLPTAQSFDDVPFVLIIPRDVDVTSLPVVVVHHGFNASRVTGFALADTAGRAGFAVLAIDGFQHGDRAASAVDSRHAMRDLIGPDGFAETQTFDVSGRMFGLLGVDADLRVFPAYPLAAFTQLAADTMTAVAAVQTGDWREVASADPSLAGLAFDPDRIGFVGVSMGSVVGVSVLAAEPDIGAAVLNVMPGGIVDTLCESGEFRTLMETVFLPIIGAGGPYDEVTASLALDPIVDLYRWALEPVDPLALAPHLLEQDLLIQLAGHDEVAAPRPSEAVVAASGLGGVGAFVHAPVPRVALPARRAAVRFDGAMHGMIEVAAQTSTWDEPLVPPLAHRSLVTVDNPIVAVHAQIEAFLTTFGETGHASIQQ